MNHDWIFRSLRRLSAGALLAALAAGLSGASLAAQGVPSADGQAVPREIDPLIETARAKYAMPSWSKGARRDGFALGGLEFAGLVGRPVRHDAGGAKRIFDDAAGVPRVLVELALFDEVAPAHEALLTHIAYVQSTKTLPTAAERGIRAGDLGYIGYGGRDGSKIAWLAFVVGNLEFRVKNLECDAVGAVDVRPIVEAISARALAQPALPEGAPLSKPAIERFVAEQSSVVAGESLALDLVARDLDGAPCAVDFVVGGWQQGQGYLEQDEQGRWRFHATGAGKVEITVKAFGRNSAVSTRTLKLDIAKS